MKKAFAIVLENNETSEKGFKALDASSKQVKNEFVINRFKAVEPKDVQFLMEFYGIEWTWPWHKVTMHKKTGIKMVPYPTRNPLARMACALSHYELWMKCVSDDEPYLILEHDAEFIGKLESNLTNNKYGVIGINDPRGATRLAQKFHQEVGKLDSLVGDVPTIDHMSIAQGIAGGSAYIIKPFAANEIITKVHEIGLWPNDATICQQLFPWIGVTKKYYTKVQKGLPSTTSR